MMNDPHVVALIYSVRHSETVDYSRTPPFEFKAGAFEGTIADNKVRFEMTEHFDSERAARDAVEPFIGRWEFHAYLQYGPDYLSLEFEDSEMVDRRPTQGVHTLSVRSCLGPVTATVRLTTAPKSYPSLPASDLVVDHPDVQTLFQRYRGFREGREPLGSFANFCLTVLEHSVGRTKGRRPKASAKYDVAETVLDRIAMLCDGKGGDEARKGKGVSEPFTAADKRFLESAARKLVYRVAEHHGGCGAALPLITMADFS